MKENILNIRRLGLIAVVLRRGRWRDPLVQVWALLGGLLVLGIFGHYVWSAGAGENKNEEGSARLFPSGKHQGTDWQPVTPFSATHPEIKTDSAANPEMDFRALASFASGSLGWHHLSPAIRQEISARRNTVTRVSITWSGTPGGDAAALEWYHDHILGKCGGTPGDFIIGNGRRSGDGRVETSHHWLKGDSENSSETIVCLVGETPTPTQAQEAALGELITALEARSGRVEIGMHRAKTTRLLAGLE